ncbi:hypothetical protein F2Q69_00035968 [Brassica cretica]|uniref:Uncharacterized protein n=1 Tax=Brassica cretica TaxID=69181 RepID=A0A8S9SIA1_BRACR|nr:hypothetical protein F2Q69_00035968 [Brassica cretica]
MTTEKMMTMKMSDAGDNDGGHEMPKKSHTVEEDKFCRLLRRSCAVVFLSPSVVSVSAPYCRPSSAPPHRSRSVVVCALASSVVICASASSSIRRRLYISLSRVSDLIKGNNRRVRSFIAKIRAFDGICRLCVKVITDSASCTKQTTDTFASHVPLNDIPAFGSTVQREKQVVTDSASCNKKTTDTFASPPLLNAIPVFGSTVQREKRVRLPDYVLNLPNKLNPAGY